MNNFRELEKNMNQAEKIPSASESIIIQAEPNVLYRLWEAPETRSRIGGTIFNHASTLDKTENVSVHWRSEFEAEYPHDGEIEFKPVMDAQNTKRTEVKLTFRFPELPSAVDQLAAKTFGYDASTLMNQVLLRLKS
jgi:uncharacterized membrane protein